jgi:hypothetical protein
MQPAYRTPAAAPPPAAVSPAPAAWEAEADRPSSQPAPGASEQGPWEISAVRSHPDRGTARPRSCAYTPRTPPRLPSPTSWTAARSSSPPCRPSPLPGSTRRHTPKRSDRGPDRRAPTRGNAPAPTSPACLPSRLHGVSWSGIFLPDRRLGGLSLLYETGGRTTVTVTRPRYATHPLTLLTVPKEMRHQSEPDRPCPPHRQGDRAMSAAHHPPHRRPP